MNYEDAMVKGDKNVPDMSHPEIRFEHVTFRYPRTNIDVLKDTGYTNSFDSLYSQIKDKDSSFTFEKDYEFNNETDKSYSSGINVTKDNFVINGNGK